MSDYSLNQIDLVFKTHATDVQYKRTQSLLRVGYDLIRYIVNPKTANAVAVFSKDKSSIALYPDGYHDVFGDNNVVFRRAF